MANAHPTKPIQHVLYALAKGLNDIFDPAPPAGTPTFGTPDPNTGAVTGSLGFPTSDGLIFTASQPSQGKVTVASDGTYTYIPTQAARQAANASTTDAFTGTVREGLSTTSVTVTVPVAPARGGSTPPVNPGGSTPPVDPVGSTPPVNPGGSTPPVFVGGSRPALFVGDYSSGDFSQWNWIQNVKANADAGTWPATGSYPAQIVIDPQRGPVARFEVRNGDRSSTDPSRVDRSEVSGVNDPTGGTEGQQRWYDFSVKFDSTFPSDTGSWGVLTNQWHANVDGPPPLAFYAVGDQWELQANIASAPGVYRNTVVLWQTPIDKGGWHDMTMVINWSKSDSIGYVQLWQNGIRQTLLNGKDTYYVRTLVPGSANSATYYKEGIYREDSSSTAVVYHGGFRTGSGTVVV